MELPLSGPDDDRQTSKKGTPYDHHRYPRTAQCIVADD